MMALHRVRTATTHKSKAPARKPRVSDLRWSLTAPASLSDVAELWASANAPAEDESASAAARFLRDIGAPGDVARAIAGVPRG